MMPKSVVVVSHMVNPEWCLAVNTTYLMPASLASAAQSAGSNLRGIEGLRQVFEEAAGVGFVGAGQGMGDDHAGLAIDRPVDEQAEALVAKPLQASG